jgi:hypothetical protein
MPACNTHQTVALDIVRRPMTTLIHELGRYMRRYLLSEQAHQPFTLKRDLTKAEASKLIDEMRKEQVSNRELHKEIDFFQRRP